MIAGKELLVAEVTNDELIRFVEMCKSEEKSVSEKMSELIQNFLSKGDNHLIA